MATQTEEEEPKARRDNSDRFETWSAEHDTPTALGWAVLGCLGAGAVGLYKAWQMQSPAGVLVCLLGSVAAFGVVMCFILGKR